MKSLAAAAALIFGCCAAAAAAQSSLEGQVLQHLEKHRATPEKAPAPLPRRDPASDPLTATALGSLEERGAGEQLFQRGHERAAGGLRTGLGGLLVIVPVAFVLAVGLFFSRRQALNYGLRYSRALAVGAFLAGAWTWASMLGGVAGSTPGLIVQFLVIPGMVLWSLPLLVALKERLLEHEIFRRWFSFERGGSARWAGPRHYRAHQQSGFSKGRDPEEGYVNG